MKNLAADELEKGHDLYSCCNCFASMSHRKNKSEEIVFVAPHLKEARANILAVAMAVLCCNYLPYSALKMLLSLG